MNAPKSGSRWVHTGSHTVYTVLCVANTANPSKKQSPQQVVHRDTDGQYWAMSLFKWPGNLIPEIEFKAIQEIKNAAMAEGVALDDETAMAIIRGVCDSLEAHFLHGTGKTEPEGILSDDD